MFRRKTPEEKQIADKRHLVDEANKLARSQPELADVVKEFIEMVNNDKDLGKNVKGMRVTIDDQGIELEGKGTHLHFYQKFLRENLKSMVQAAPSPAEQLPKSPESVPEAGRAMADDTGSLHSSVRYERKKAGGSTSHMMAGLNESHYIPPSDQNPIYEKVSPLPIYEKVSPLDEYDRVESELASQIEYIRGESKNVVYTRHLGMMEKLDEFLKTATDQQQDALVVDLGDLIDKMKNDETVNNRHDYMNDFVEIVQKHMNGERDMEIETETLSLSEDAVDGKLNTNGEEDMEIETMFLSDEEKLNLVKEMLEKITDEVADDLRKKISNVENDGSTPTVWENVKAYCQTVSGLVEGDLGRLVEAVNSGDDKKLQDLHGEIGRSVSSRPF